MISRPVKDGFFLIVRPPIVKAGNGCGNVAADTDTLKIMAPASSGDSKPTDHADYWLEIQGSMVWFIDMGYSAVTPLFSGSHTSHRIRNLD